MKTHNKNQQRSTLKERVCYRHEVMHGKMDRFSGGEYYFINYDRVIELKKQYPNAENDT